MKRREFICGSVAAGLATWAARASAQSVSMPVIKPLRIDAYSRHLQWLRTADDVAEAVLEMGYDGLDITVTPYPGHVDPARVAQDLPPFVSAVRKHGIEVSTISCPVADADSPNTESILQTASALGITHYWGGSFRYDATKPVMPQLEALKPRIEKLAALNTKYKLKAMYHTYEGFRIVGAAIWDLLYVLKNLDPAFVGIHYDLGHMVVAGGANTWELSLRAAGPYIGGVSVKDYVWEDNLGISGGGAYAGQPLAAVGGPTAGGRGQGGLGPGNNVPAIGGNVSPVSGTGAPPAVVGENAVAQAAAGRGSPVGPQGPDNRGAAPAGRGGGGMPNPWKVRPVPLGEGMDNLPEFANALKDIAFSGPLEIQAEYPNGGAGNGQDKIALPREQVLGAMKRDRIVLRSAFGPSGLL